MKYEIVTTFPHAIIFSEDGPFISLYQRTHRYSPENKRDPIVFKNLVREIEESLSRSYPKRDVAELLGVFRKLEGDKDFWNNTQDGLAVLANMSQCIVYRLPKPVQQLAVVADSFHIKPLVKTFQSAFRYQLLGLSASDFTLFEGNRYEMSELEIDPSVPRTRQDVLGDQYTEAYLTHGSYGGAGGTGIFHGHGADQEEVDKDTEKFFRYVDKFVADNYSKPSKLPLILVSVKEHHKLFAKLSSNPKLLEIGIRLSYDSLEREQLREKAWEIMEPVFRQEIRGRLENFQSAWPKGLASPDLAEIAKAAWENRVDTIFVAEDTIVPGVVSRETGKIEHSPLDDPSVNDILDDLAQAVLRAGGSVLVLPKAELPGDTGAAAVFRY